MYDTNLENTVISLLKTYGSMPLKLIFCLSKQDEKIMNTVISKMLRKKMIYLTNEYSIGLFSAQESDARLLMALWFISEYIDNINLSDIYRASFPFCIGFIMNGQLFRIAVIDSDSEMTFPLFKLDKNEKYILIVPSETYIAKLNYVSKPNVMFAVYEKTDNTQKPEFKKYRTRRKTN